MNGPGFIKFDSDGSTCNKFSFSMAGAFLEVFGCDLPCNGRSCLIHEGCERLIWVGCLLKLNTVYLPNPLTEVLDVLAVVATYIGGGCRVGFLPTFLLSRHLEFEGKIVKVIELMKDSTNPVMLLDNKRNSGGALCRIEE